MESWTTSGDASVRKSRRSAYEGSRDLRLRRGTGFAARSVDLRGYADALLRACVRVRSFEGSDRALVLFSTDGGATWSTVHIFVNGDDDNTYHCFEWALPAGLVVTIAFDAAMSGKRDQVWFDAIEVVARPGG